MPVGRREFVRRVSAVAAVMPASVLALAASLEAQLEIPSEFDTSLESIAVAFRCPTGMTLGYLSQPKGREPHPGIVLLHDVSGLTPGMRGVARNLATSGYAVVAPDFLSPQGGVSSFRGVDADVQRAVTATNAAAVAPQATSAVAFVKSHGGAGGRGVALVGIGWGATQSLLFAAGRTDIAACVAFYPDPQQTLRLLARTSAPALVVLAGDDPETKASADALAQAAAASRHPHVVRVFAGVSRGFHDPGDKKAYKPDVAKQAWTAVLEHLNAQSKKAGTGEGRA
jgi:carboxymethylenebutenolidase